MPLGKKDGKPTFFYDGDCGFCRYWTNYWRKLTADRVEYKILPKPASSSELVDVDGQVYHGAAGVAHLLSYAEGKWWFLWLYKHLPVFAMIAEWSYKRISSCRKCAARFTRWFWGERLEPPTFIFTRKLFLRLLGAVYAISFFSLALQIPGLIGPDGILPNANASLLQPLAFLGAALGVITLIGFQLAPIFFLLWLFYLVIFYAGGAFLSFQWDIFLLEAGFLAIFFAPTRLGVNTNPSPVIVWLYRFLVFRLMFGSGVVKLASGDPSWRSLSALDFHYFTQPIPNPVSWYVHQLPTWFQHTNVLLMFVVQLIVPFFIFAPRRLRFFAAFCFLALEGLIAVTGNFSFFNWLTMATVLLLFDDQFFRATSKIPNSKFQIPKWTPRILATVVIVLFLFQFPTPLRLVNPYGVFATMTTKRNEIVMEGSMDGQTWSVYEFKYKPGDVSRRPPFIAPYQPRLDWQMWFAALSTYERTPWFVRFSEKLLRASPDVLALLEHDPFNGIPPKYLRASLYEYHFTNYDERRETGDWWKRESRGLYLPVTQLKK